ncbi:hypothetical protein VPARA_24790 [Variovorax paradoxus]|uniref:Uncharacterized protein n=1 Tax=Variovorax paradoxus TaxID=34073 RepID=A0A0H2M6Z4_VARPD|nr:hypothetical protein VPARA_24790 [Variovorax paradoxus]
MRFHAEREDRVGGARSVGAIAARSRAEGGREVRGGGVGVGADGVGVLRVDQRGVGGRCQRERGAVVLEDHHRADFCRCAGNLQQPKPPDVEVRVGVARGIEGRPVFDEYAVVVRRRRVFDRVAGLDAGDRRNAVGDADGDGRTHAALAAARKGFKNRSGHGVEHAHARDRNHRVARIAVDEAVAGLDPRAVCGDLDLGSLAALQLHNVEIGSPRSEHAGEVDVRLQIGLVLVQVRNGDVRPGAGHEREADALLLGDHLAVGAECGRVVRATGLAANDRVTSVDVDSGRFIRRILARRDDRHVGNPAADDRRIGLREHQEQVIARWRTLEIEIRILADTDEDLVQQVD